MKPFERGLLCCLALDGSIATRYGVPFRVPVDCGGRWQRVVQFTTQLKKFPR